ncbi:glycosyltransferase [Candidatus Dependentiae bacterium]|nr:glycosyltransferase [Candidatus Dependentiae bacterium]MCG2756432.1 glycosyltransferase [Candidatus Dependentiae bacterium]
MKIKKILLVGFFSNNNKYRYADSFCNKFIKLGYEVKKFDYRKRYFFINFLNNHIINFLLLKTIKKFNPDLIFFIKAENIYTKTLKKLKQKNRIIVNFYPDNVFSLWNSNSNEQVLKNLSYYDYFLSWAKILELPLKSAGAENVYYFPFAYDKNIYDKEIIFSNQDISKYKSEVCFVGTWDKERELCLTKLIELMPDLDLAIWGNLWFEMLPKNSKLRSKIRGNAIYKDDLIKAFKLSKIVLNFIRKQNTTSHNMRTMEVPATKSFLLTQHSEEQAEILFKENESIVCFDSIEKLCEKIKYYLNNKQEREKIVLNSYNRVQEFELKIVLKKFMEYIQSM